LSAFIKSWLTTIINNPIFYNLLLPVEKICCLIDDTVVTFCPFNVTTETCMEHPTENPKTSVFLIYTIFVTQWINELGFSEETVVLVYKEAAVE
jgi:hypothetical protein